MFSDEQLEKMREASEHFQEVMKTIEQEQEAYWNSLSKEDQLKAFCAVARRIRQAEMIDQGSYRHALYGVFGFGPEAYAQAQDAGYLDIHNAIYTSEHETRMLKAFCIKNNIENADEKVRDFLL